MAKCLTWAELQPCPGVTTAASLQQGQNELSGECVREREQNHCLCGTLWILQNLCLFWCLSTPSSPVVQCVSECFSRTCYAPAVNGLRRGGELEYEEKENVKGEERETGVDIFSADSYLLLALSGDVCVCGKWFKVSTVRPRRRRCPVKECADTKRTKLLKSPPIFLPKETLVIYCCVVLCGKTSEVKDSKDLLFCQTTEYNKIETECCNK